MDPATWMMIASAVLTVAGSVVESNANKAAARRRKSAISDQDANQNPFRNKASEELKNTSDQFDPNLRKQRMEKRDASNLATYRTISDKNEGVREGSVFSDGNIQELERYDAPASADREERRERNMINASKFFSPQQAGNIDETQMINEMAGKLNTNRNFARGQFNVDQQIIDSIRPDSGALMMAGILKGLGTVTGFAGAGMNMAASTAATEAAKKAATEAAIKQGLQQSMGTTASRFGLETAKAIGPTAITTSAPAIGAGAAGASNAFNFGYAPAELNKLNWANAPGIGSTARGSMFAPVGAANSGVQSRSYQLWNTPYR
jgi:hypothetical protein